MVFANRIDAGRQLAVRLAHLRAESPVVVGLPRGGVPVAGEVARAIDAPLDVIVVRKLGVPFHRELAMGAIGEDGVRVVDASTVQMTGVSPRQLAEVERIERAELERRAQRFRADRTRVSMKGRTVLIVDDGIATGSTARAACQVARAEGASKVVLAVPVAPPEWTERLAGEADELIALQTPTRFAAVGQFYEDFAPTTDAEVVDVLRRAATAVDVTTPATAARPSAVDRHVEITVGAATLGGHLTVPADADGIVIFAHGSGSSRHSPRNRFVAEVLNEAGTGTLLFDLLTVAEERDRANVFDIELLARRLVAVTRWLQTQPEAAGRRIGYFGASTGAAAALVAAADLGSDVAAVVSRGGRPDLAGPRLRDVTAPTLLVVGGNDHLVIELNREAQARLRCDHRLTIVPGATHLFEEPGTLEAAADEASAWFATHLTRAPSSLR